MLTKLHQNNRAQLLLGLAFGIVFGFLLQKGGVTDYDVILGQLLLTDFTVVKIMLTAVVTGMLGIHLMRAFGWVRLSPKPGSLGTSMVGGLVFGAGFATLGYCPGTIAGAIGNGYLDALAGGLAGILVGAALFAALYPRLNRAILPWVDFGPVTLPELFRVNPWAVVLPVAGLLVLLLVWIESAAGA
ncbi:MAG TPA: YeeE/YedE thiosulfate transporter family protein [Acidobacteriota bacterium]|jgi:hypothetical protein|nr:YeeE/YedE thiosulfate transporter family protein [Acidobacteriota bacterium]HNU02478.1 YeeE/YedE thiosulfate transporter family protein [Acidobacteriota bacterium]HQO27090.1 YeeE/YedE thiosulfate transporter family protein [Acidobacteriota bacterium]